MLTITKPQSTALDAQALSGFYKRACAFLRENAGKDVEKFDDAKLRQFVESSHKTAVAHGTSSERSSMMWMCLAIMAGPNFHETPELVELLRPGRNVDTVLNQLFERLAVLEARRRPV